MAVPTAKKLTFKTTLLRHIIVGISFKRKMEVYTKLFNCKRIKVKNIEKQKLQSYWQEGEGMFWGEGMHMLQYAQKHSFIHFHQPSPIVLMFKN